MSARFFTSWYGASGFVLVLFFLASLPMVLGGGKWSLALAAVLCFLVIPFVFIQRVFREDPALYGWRLPAQGSRALLWSVVVFTVQLPVIVYFSQLPAFQSFYSTEQLPLVVVGVLSAAYFFAEEFLFRGFLFFTLWKRYAAWAFVINAVLFAVLHFAKPSYEIVFAAVSAALLCFLSLHTKSFLPAASVHFATALTLNLLVYTS